MQKQWKSKFKYTLNGATNYLEFSQRSQIYFLKNKKGGIHPVDKEMGDSLRRCEIAHTTIGRPTLFPACDVDARSITLPKKYWEKLTEPYSKAIANLIEGVK